VVFFFRKGNERKIMVSLFLICGGRNCRKFKGKVVVVVVHRDSEEEKMQTQREMLRQW
jgi:hypothetical protein